MRCRLKTHNFDAFRSSVQTNTLKTHRFENALESGSNRKRVHMVLLWTVENILK